MLRLFRPVRRMPFSMETRTTKHLRINSTSEQCQIIYNKKGRDSTSRPRNMERISSLFSIVAPARGRGILGSDPTTRNQFDPVPVHRMGTS